MGICSSYVYIALTAITIVKHIARLLVGLRSYAYKLEHNIPDSQKILSAEILKIRISL